MLFTPFAFVKQAAAGGYDPDAQAFITAAGISGSNADAINTLVLDLKNYGLWTKMYVVYPLIGASSTSQKLNLLNPNTYTGSFKTSGGSSPNSMVFYNQGLLKNTSGDYMDSGFIDSNTNWTYTNAHMSINFISTTTSDGYLMGGTNSSPAPYNEFSKSGFYFFQNGNETKYFSPTTVVQSGSIVVTVDPTNQQPTSYVDGANQRQAGAISTNSHTSKKITIASVDGFGGSAGSWLGKVNFATIGQSLSSTNASNLNTVINTYLTNVGTSIYDSDARNYVNAILAAGGSLTTAQQLAIDVFYQQLKADTVYSNLYFMYPFLGGVANSNKINGINPGTYDLTFNGTWTHSSTGSNADVRDAGTYADTGYNANSSTVATNWSFGYIHDPTVTGGNNEGYSGVGTSSTNYMILGFYNFTTLDAWFPANSSIGGGMSSDGSFLVMKRSASNAWKAGSINSGSAASSGFTYGGNQSSTWPGYNGNIYINKINSAGLPGIGLYSFAFAGTHLTDTQMNNFLVAVNNLQAAFGKKLFS